MSHLSFNNVRISFNEIQNGDYAATNPYNKSVLDFCADWLNGKNIFHLFTSGSTGKPKEITLSRTQMKASAEMTAKALGLRPGYHSLVCLNTEYIAGKMMLVRGLETNMDMTLVAPSSNPMLELEENIVFDFTAMVPLQLQSILKDTPTKLNQLNRCKAIILGGAPVGKKLEEEIQQIKSPVYVTFGMTETVSHIALRRLNGEDKSPYYKVLPGVTIGQDNRNCLTIKSDVTNQQEIITNDVVEMKGTDQFLWLGRIDHVINSGGIKIQAEKVEAAIEEVFNTLKIEKRFFISGIAHATLGQAVTLFIEGEKLSDEDLVKNILKGKLSKYEIPKEIMYVNLFSETATGKINQKLTVEKMINF